MKRIPLKFISSQIPGIFRRWKNKKIICKINCIGNYVALIKVIEKGSFDDMRKYVSAVFQNFVKYLFDIKTNIGIIMST